MKQLNVRRILACSFGNYQTPFNHVLVNDYNGSGGRGHYRVTFASKGEQAMHPNPNYSPRSGMLTAEQRVAEPTGLDDDPSQGHWMDEPSATECADATKALFHIDGANDLSLAHGDSGGCTDAVAASNDTCSKANILAGNEHVKKRSECCHRVAKGCDEPGEPTAQKYVQREQESRMELLARPPVLRPTEKKAGDLQPVSPRQDVHDDRHRTLLTRGGFFIKHGRFGKPHMRFVWMSQDLESIMWR